ncbi:MAG: DinB family protein [Tepidisphaeraceae bacterium]|jgi:uncharacterized damage-inducible protein DinB
MDRKIIDEFENGSPALKKAIDGLTRGELLWLPPPEMGVGRWSIQQVVFHLMDDELIWTARMKQVIAEDNPKIITYDEAKMAAKTFCEEEDAQVALQILDLNRRQFSIVLKNLPESAFARTGEHSTIGIFTLEQAVVWTQEHLGHHVHYIGLKREKFGKPM